MPGIIAILLDFFSLIKEHGKHFQKSINNLLPSSVSVECLDTGIAKNDLVGLEAILNIADKKWSLFLCILGLSTVLHRNIYTYYPDSCCSINLLNQGKMLNILEVIFIFYFVMKAFWGLRKFFNQIINLWLLATPLVTPLATPYIFLPFQKS